MPLTIAVVAEGNANTTACWSGSGKTFVDALRAEGVKVDAYDVELRTWRRALTAIWTFHPNRARWRQRYLLGACSFRARSWLADRLIATSATAYDAVLQFGATFATGVTARRGAPSVLYCDGNVAIARRGAPYSGASSLRETEFAAVAARERRVYDAANRIYTMSGALARSFQDDFAQPVEKVLTVYAGANNPPTPLRVAGGPPSILFVGKDHERKGSAVLLAAFAKVRAALPTAELHLVGGIPPDADRPGIVAHGVLARSNPVERQLLDRLFGSATVFCMPSRHEPFGIVFLEAMLAGLPCIGTMRWAMPEIIVDGETGWLVPDGAVDELAVVLLEALRDPPRAAKMGARGRERVLAKFTWAHVARRVIDDVRTLRPGAASPGEADRPSAR